jgi:hypothetical protein
MQLFYLAMKNDHAEVLEILVSDGFLENDYFNRSGKLNLIDSKIN